MLLFIPRSLCALKRVAAKVEHSRFGATTGIRIVLIPGLFRAEACDGHRAMVAEVKRSKKVSGPFYGKGPDTFYLSILLSRFYPLSARPRSADVHAIGANQGLLKTDLAVSK